MKKTGVLKVLCDSGYPVNKLVIHPNTGFDLGFMQIKYVTRTYINTSVEDFKSGSAEMFCDMDLFLLNECRDGTVEMGPRLWSSLGEPEKALLIYDDSENRLMVAAGK